MTALVTYKAVADKGEQSVDLKSYLVLRNFSGEDFQSARCLLDYGEPVTTGLSHEETKRILFLKQESVPIEKEFTWDAALKPHDPEEVEGNVGIPVQYVIRNDAESSLGRHALWGGKARIFHDDGHGSTIFLGEDVAEFTPVGGKVKLYIGDSRDVVVTQRRMSSEQQNIRRRNGGGVEVYDELIHDKAEIENFKDEEVILTVVEHIPGHWDMIECNYDYEKEDYSTLKFRIKVPSREKVTLLMEYKLRNVFAAGYSRFNSVVE